ncbi:MAG: hypothetical protein GY799_11695 [Desulfobulbaceae bacterium]|nr:hypothetical protein [Desulfobulbaceae bacterium]
MLDKNGGGDVNASTCKILHALQQWKTKAIARRQQVEALKNRITDLAESRDTWKAQAHANQKRIAELQPVCQ